MPVVMNLQQQHHFLHILHIHFLQLLFKFSRIVVIIMSTMMLLIVTLIGTVIGTGIGIGIGTVVGVVDYVNVG